jgi:hypothetical protein
MTKHDDENAEGRRRDMGRTQQQAIMEALSHPPIAYNEEARRILGSPLGCVAGKTMTQPEIVTSIMTTGSLKV